MNSGNLIERREKIEVGKKVIGLVFCQQLCSFLKSREISKETKSTGRKVKNG